MSMNIKDIIINEENNIQEYANILKKKGRVQIKNFFSNETAIKLAKLFDEHNQWYLAYNEFNNFYESDYKQVESMPDDIKAQFMQSFYKRAENGFQYVFKQFYISQAVKLNENSPLNFLHDYTNQKTFISLMQKLAGDNEISWVDAFASSYESGHFLTEHNDIHNKHNRVLAFTLGLTKNWNPNWGGNLVFFDKDKNIEEGFIPSFNTLNVFIIPQNHAVQFVTPSAKKDRLSFLGWANK